MFISSTAFRCDPETMQWFPPQRIFNAFLLSRIIRIIYFGIVLCVLRFLWIVYES